MLYIDVKGVIESEQEKVFMELFGGWQEVFTAETVQRALDENPSESEVTLNIDCNGGSTEEGFKIYDKLRTSGKTIFANITGSCHSMAVIVLLAAPKENRSANQNVRALIHKVRAGVCGYVTADECLELAEDIIREEEAMLDIYHDRTGIDRETLSSVMRKEQTHDAKSLLELNFISKINKYNTNQFFNSIQTMADNKPNAFKSFMEKVNAYRSKTKPKNEVFEYRDENGELVFTSEVPHDELAEGSVVTLTNGEASGTFVLEDRREVVIEDNVVTEIRMVDEESLLERLEEVERILEEATNLIQEQEAELNNLRGSDYKPKNRRTAVPSTKGVKAPSNVDTRSKDEIKNASKERRQMVAERTQVKGRKA